jgi:hypothetical protein
VLRRIAHRVPEGAALMSSQYEEILREVVAAGGELSVVRETVKLQTLREAEQAMVKAIILLKQCRMLLANHVPVESKVGQDVYARITDLIGD